MTTGISAHDRAHTVAVAIDATKGPDDVVSPGHVFPLVARDGGVLVRAGPGPLGGGEDGVHGRRGRGLITWPVHDRSEARRAVSVGADLVFISPIHPTRSHPGAPALGLRRARAIIKGQPVRPIALGGMTRRNGRTAMRSGFWGWAAIDGWSA